MVLFPLTGTVLPTALHAVHVRLHPTAPPPACLTLSNLSSDDGGAAAGPAVRAAADSPVSSLPVPCGPRSCGKTVSRLPGPVADEIVTGKYLATAT